jgi:hypothetical protein
LKNQHQKEIDQLNLQYSDKKDLGVKHSKDIKYLEDKLTGKIKDLEKDNADLLEKY